MPAAIEIKSLSKVYGNGFKALNGLSLTVEQGDFYALLGPNGAGKSTTIGILSSLVKKTDGKVRIFGCDIDTDFSKAKEFIGVVPQEFNFNMFEKVEDIIINQAGYYGLPRAIAKERSEKYLKKLGLWDKRAEPSRGLSGGMKRRLMIVRALIHEPKLLILDEPTAGVDIELRRSMWQFLTEINEQGTTIILTTHYLEEAESLCRNVGIINNGELVENTSIKNLLKQLTKETFVFDLAAPLDVPPTIDGYTVEKTDNATLEIAVDKGQSLNVIFDQLTQKGVSVISMRSKSNRLEELFVSLVESSQAGKGGAS